MIIAAKISDLNVKRSTLSSPSMGKPMHISELRHGGTR